MVSKDPAFVLPNAQYVEYTGYDDVFLEKRILKWPWDQPRMSDASVQLDPEEISWAIVENRNPNC